LLQAIVIYARMLKTLLTDDGGIFSSPAIARTPKPLFFKSATVLEYAFNVAGRPSLTPRFMAAARPALTRGLRAQPVGFAANQDRLHRIGPLQTD